jgi:hypothetical protein
MKLLSTGRIIGSALVVIAYFVVIHVDLTTGVVMHFLADAISMPYFIITKHWDIVIMLTFLLIVSTSKLFVL